MIAPDVSPRKYWWPLLQRQTTVAFKLGQKGDNSILLFPAGTVDNLIGKLRSIFIEAGRGNAWNDILGVGNPAAHHSVKQYLTLVREEQAKARVGKNKLFLSSLGS